MPLLLQSRRVGQLEKVREIGGHLRIVELENVTSRDEAAKARLINKTNLKRLELVWGASSENQSQAGVIEALRPTQNLQFLTIHGYKGATYPTWLQDVFFLRNLRHLCLRNCNALSSLPSNFHMFRRCSELVLENLGALKVFSTFSETFGILRINKCPSLIFVGENEHNVDVHQLGIKVERDLLGFTFISTKSNKTLLDHEIKSFEQTGSLEHCREQLRVIQSADLQGADLPWCVATPLKLKLNRAWWSCHQQRMNFIYSGNNLANKLTLSPGLRILELRYCCISNGALSDCLKGMAALEKLYLEGIMTITTLPPKQVLQSLTSLRVLKIVDCWCLSSLGGLHELPRLQKFDLRGCCLLLKAKGSPWLPSSLRSFTTKKCKLPSWSFGNDLPYLEKVFVFDCRVSLGVLEFHQLPSLKTLFLFNCNLKRVDLLLPVIDTLAIVQNPFPEVTYYQDDQIGRGVARNGLDCQNLVISSLSELVRLLPFHNSRLRNLKIIHCPDFRLNNISDDGIFLGTESSHARDYAGPSSISRDSCPDAKRPRTSSVVHRSAGLIPRRRGTNIHEFDSAIRTLLFRSESWDLIEWSRFYREMQRREREQSRTARASNVLESVSFIDCPNLLELPGLPDSVECIEIHGCPILKQRCQPNGPEWHKIQHIPKYIERQYTKP